jgi:hypothetical protein
MTRTSVRRARLAAVLGVVVALTAATALPAEADGTETLGPPSIAIADGTGVAAGGVGLRNAQPADIDVSVPGDATVNQVLLYWEGGHEAGMADNTLEVEGTEVAGTLIGGPTLFFWNIYSSSYRADITSLGVISPGANSVSVGGLNDAYNNGAGIVVIYSSPSEPEAQISLVDGNDLAFRDFAAPLNTTAAQTFNFAAAASDRTVGLTLLASSVSDGGYRPSVVTVESGGITEDFLDVFANTNGAEWDTVTLPVTIPAGATSLTVQALSDDHGTGALPASFAWTAAALVVPGDAPPPPPPPEGCTRTLGYWKTHSAKGPAPFDPTWNLIAPSAENSPFFSSGKSYYDTLWTAPRGNAYWILAQQYIAAELNVLAGASIPADVAAVWAQAKTWFETYTPATVTSAARAQAISWAGTLDDYNNGLSGPGHCGDTVHVPTEPPYGE